MQKLLFSVLLTSLLPLCARAVDGVVEINQAAVLAAGGFPYQIQAPGSYRLTSNLDLRGLPNPESTTAILVSVADVSIDLNGFAIIGATVCSGLPPVDPVTCAPTGSGRGISATGARNTIANGVVRGMGNRGVVCGELCRVERVKVEDCGLTGIEAGSGATVAGNKVRNNATVGIVTGTGAVIHDNVADQNGSNGISAEGGADISGNTSMMNRVAGIVMNTTSTARANVVSQNRGDGITGTSGNLARDNVARGNGGFGINFGGVGATSGYVNNVFGANTLGATNGGVSLGLNACDAALCP